MKKLLTCCFWLCVTLVVIMFALCVAQKAKAQVCVTATPTPTPSPVMVCWTYTPTNTATNTSTNTSTPVPTSTPTRTLMPTMTPKPTSTPAPSNVYYIDSVIGNDNNPGAINSPWRTMAKSLPKLQAGDTLYFRAGTYTSNVWQYGHFAHSGTEESPITVSNYPGEKVTILVTDTRGVGWDAFMCWDVYPKTRADYIHIIGDGNFILKSTIPDVKSYGIWAGGNCDNWEISGIRFEGLAAGIFMRKETNDSSADHSPDNWYIHDNVVYGYTRESGFQIAGNYNVIENNEIYKAIDTTSAYGCQMINILGHHNTVRGNTLSSLFSNVNCMGILFEWDISDYNYISGNVISDTGWGNSSAIHIAGGDNNVITGNTIYASSPDWYYINPGTGTWPCNEPSSIIPGIGNDDYEYYFPHDCKSVGNEIYGNTWIYQQDPKRAE